MKYLVLGCNGMAGHMVARYLAERGCDVTGFARRESSIVTTIVGDATDFERLRSIISEGGYDVIINCIGILNQFAEERPSQAILLNSYLPHFLADMTKESPTRIVHISTDCVFSGRKGHYTEDDIPDGTSVYDRTKALGELNDNKNLTIRSSIVGPDINEKGIGLLNWFLHQKGTIKGYTNAIWTGQTTLQLAKTIEAAVDQNIVGLINAVPDRSISKYDLLCLFNRYLREDPLEIIPDERVCVDKSLICSRKDFDYHIPEYEVMISELAVWMKEHN